ncbi:MAG: CHAT domain-containing protein [Lentimicrobiaceae bacterium]|nr:CHAT domain-containing protein [Lentimicrobiaceae bacterium]
MKKIVLFVIISFLALTASAQSAEQILNKVDSLKNQNNYTEAIDFLKKNIELFENDTIYPSMNNALGDLYYDLEDYNQVEKYFLEAKDIGKKVFGKKHLVYAIALSNLGVLNDNLGNHSTAEKYYLEALPIRKKALGIKHPEYATSLNILGSLYYNMGDFSKAEKYYLEVLSIREKTLGKEHPDYITSLYNLGWLYDNMREYYYNTEQYSVLIPFLLKNLFFREAHFGEKSSEYFFGLWHLAAAHYIKGEHYAAQLTASKLLSYDLKLEPELKAKIDTLLLSSYQVTGDYLKSIELCHQILAEGGLSLQREEEIIQSLISSYNSIDDIENFTIWNERLAALTGITIDFLDNEALRYSSIKDFAMLLSTRRKSLNLREEKFGFESIEYAIGLIDYAGAMAIFVPHLYDSATISLYTTVGINILRGHNSENLRLMLGTAADNYTAIGRYEEAESLLWERIDIKLSQGDTSSCLWDYHYLAYIKRLQKDYETSSNLYINVINFIYENNLQLEEKTLFIDCMIGLAKTQEELHNYEISEEILLQALYELQENYNGVKSFRLESVLLQLSSIYNKTKQYDKQLEVLEKSLEYYSNSILSKWFFLSEAQREVYWDESNRWFNSAPAIYWIQNPSADMANLFSMILFKKGLLLNSNIGISKLIYESEDKTLIDKYKTLQSIKNLSEFQWSDSLWILSEKIERELIRDSKVFGDFTNNLKFNWQDVQNSLSKNDIAIEFIDFFIPEQDSLIYAALILRKDWNAPKMVTLFEKRELDKLLAAGNSEAERAEKRYSGYVGKQIAKLVWQPLAEFINEGDNVYFSPSGVLHHIAIEYLPSGDNRLMNEMYNLYRLSSTKQLCYSNPAQKYNKATLYGGLIYDLTDTTMIAESKMYAQTHDKYAMRGFEIDTVNRAGWKMLHGTKTEVNNISKILTNNNINNIVFQEEKGNEESFRALSGQKNNILHIATHGFFYSSEDAQKKKYFGMQNDNKPVIDNSMRRSGLILSGGNAAWRGEPVPEGIEDGVLTAQEIMSLDLRGADLVVLSACETGLGDVTGEGVFGLQRAFKMAGAQTLIMSLWKVSDAATELMMSTFYENLLSGKTKRESFFVAQATVKAKYTEPYYWAAFIMLD